MVSFLCIALIAANASAEDPSPWLLDVNVGMPRLKRGGFSLAGDGMVGYAAPRLGILLRGSGSTYDMESTAYGIDTLRGDAEGEAWWQAGDPRADASFEVRASGGSSLYSSTYTPRSAAAGYWHDEDSWMARGALLLGGRFRARPGFEMRVLAGAGLQHETRDVTSIDPRAAALLSSTDQTSSRFEGRLTAVYRVVPQTLSVRLHCEGDRFTITRESLVVGSLSSPGTSLNSSTFQQLEIRTRLSILGDFAAFFGFIPTVWAGLDYVRMSSGEGTISTAVPLAGLGLLRSWL